MIGRDTPSPPDGQDANEINGRLESEQSCGAYKGGTRGFLGMELEGHR